MSQHTLPFYDSFRCSPRCLHQGWHVSIDSIDYIAFNNCLFKIGIKNLKFLKPLILQGISPAQCSVFMYFPLFLPLRTETRFIYLSIKLFFRTDNEPSAFESEIHSLHKSALRARRYLLAHDHRVCWLI